MGFTATAGSTAQIDYTVLDNRARAVELRVGDSWSFGRSPRCSQTLALPGLSRLCLVLQAVAPGLVRLVSRQSNRGRVHVLADEGTERHVIGLGSGPVHLAGGNYTLKVELPPVVLRGQIAIPLRWGEPPPCTPARGVGPASEATRMSCDPRPGDDDGRAWLAVVAMAVTLARFPELGRGDQQPPDMPVRPSETLRRAVALWTGHSSHYWVNQRLKEAADAADLHVKEGWDRVAVVVTHYAPFFSDVALRRMRDELVELGLQARRPS